MFTALLAGLTNRRNLLLGLTLMVLILEIVACGDGGGGGGDDDSAGNGSTELPIDAQSVMISGLVSGEIYYWKMIARDSHSATTQSAVRNIFVQ